MSWAKNGVLTTVVDDFYDIGGTEEELVQLIQLLEKYIHICSSNPATMLFPFNFNSELVFKNSHVMKFELQVGCRY